MWKVFSKLLFNFLQSRARGNTVTDKITQAGDKAGAAANEMGKEKAILRWFMSEKIHMRGCKHAKGEGGGGCKKKIC